MTATGSDAPVHFEPTDPGSDIARALLEAYAREVATRCGMAGPWQRLATTDPDHYGAPGGCFLLVRIDGAAVGCGGLRTIGPGVLEVKRMYVAREGRGRGVGAGLLRALIERATAMGAHRLVLDTRPELVEATALYEAAGFRRVPSYNDNADAGLWFELALDGAAPG